MTPSIPQTLWRQPRAISLYAIDGVSALNPRAADCGDLDGLAASMLASGQLQPLIVTPGSDPDAYVILDGQRRWRAMRLLVEQGHWAGDHSIDVDIATGDEAELREIALAANALRRQLHPVEEYEAFAALARAGFDEARIAKDFSLGLRHVRQRLALGRLSPKILAAWRDGDIAADVAQAFTAGETHEAQEAVFDEFSREGSNALNATLYQIRRKLRSDALSGECKEALYVGLDAYLAAGGRIEEDLFSEEITFRDGALLKRLARKKLLAEAEAIAAAEGWGFVAAWSDRPEGDYLIEDYDLDFLPAEAERIEALEERQRGLRRAVSSVSFSPDDRAALDDIERELEEINRLALLRSIPQAARARLGVIADLDCDGTATFGRGFEPRAAEDTQDENESVPGRAPVSEPASGSLQGAEKGAAVIPAGAAAPERNARALRAVLDEAVNTAFHDCIITRPDLALMVAVAQLGTGPSQDSVKLSGHMNRAFERQSELLKKLQRLSFDKALAVCANAPHADLVVAFAEIVALSIDVANPGYSDAPLSMRAPLAKALAARGAPLKEALDRALDREAYFAAATKQACLAVVDALGTPAINRADKKSAIADYVAADAAKKHWLPSPLADWTRLKATSPERPRDEPEEKPLGQAMAEAIDADEKQRRVKINAVCDLKGGAPLFAEFLISHVRFADGLECKASDLRAAYVAQFDGSRPLTAAEIGAMMLDLGVAKTRRKDGIYYKGIGLIEPAAAIEEAA